LIDGGDQYLLNGAFQHRAGIAEQASVLQSADAAPDDGLFAAIVPVNPAENLAAFAANNYLSEAVVAAEGSGFSVRAGVDDAATDKFLLESLGTVLFDWRKNDIIEARQIIGDASTMNELIVKLLEVLHRCFHCRSSIW